MIKLYVLSLPNQAHNLPFYPNERKVKRTSNKHHSIELARIVPSGGRIKKLLSEEKALR